MTEQETFILADRTLLQVVNQIKDDQWDMVIPEWFQTGGQDKHPTLKTIINYHAYDDAWVPDMLSGKTMADVGADSFKGDLLLDDPKANFGAIVDTACAAVEKFADLTMTVHLSFGDYPADHYLAQITSFRGFRAYDIAKMIGVDTTLPDELVAGLWDILGPHFEEWRAIGVFPAALEVPNDASSQTRLIAKSGRS